MIMVLLFKYIFNEISKEPIQKKKKKMEVRYLENYFNRLVYDVRSNV